MSFDQNSGTAHLSLQTARYAETQLPAHARRDVAAAALEPRPGQIRVLRLMSLMICSDDEPRPEGGVM